MIEVVDKIDLICDELGKVHLKDFILWPTSYFRSLKSIYNLTGTQEMTTGPAIVTWEIRSLSILLHRPSIVAIARDAKEPLHNDHFF
jgi:hypothetical protein